MVGQSKNGPLDIVLDGGEGNDFLRVETKDNDPLYHRYQDHLIARGGDGDDVFFIYGPRTSRIDAGSGNDVLTLDMGGFYDGHLTHYTGDFPHVLAEYRIRLGEGIDIITLMQDTAHNYRPANAITFLDFAPGEHGDVLQLRDWFDLVAVGWSGENPFSTGYLSLEQHGVDTKLLLDRDGADGSAYEAEAVFTFKSTQAGTFNATNFGGWQPQAGADMHAQVALPPTSHIDDGRWLFSHLVLA